MALSVNTNNGAMIALASLNKTNADLEATQKRISTGYKVADAKDDGAAFAVAQKVRSQQAGLETANSQLTNTTGLLTTTTSALSSLSSNMKDIRTVLTNLSNSNLDDETRKQYTAQFNSLVNQMNSKIEDSSYNGKSLISSGSTASTAADDVQLLRNENADTFKIKGTAGSDLSFDTKVGYTDAVATATSGSATTVGVPASGGTAATPPVYGTPPEAATPAGDKEFSVDSISADQATALLTGKDSGTAMYDASGNLGLGSAANTAGTPAAGTLALVKSFSTIESNINSASNQYGNDSTKVSNQITYNQSKLDAMDTGLGALVDADLAKESAELSALQVRQQLGTQALGLANSSPQTILSLFR
ncbi:flagellin N-terminal helical domain-containing protein [Roseomonas elaeocarpi]|uniref:Flagellin n=1 Tax=Roseomonas elaeocarpi TaxID=907779 RepID=A0ABV6JSP0_9PROT